MEASYPSPAAYRNDIVAPITPTTSASSADSLGELDFMNFGSPQRTVAPPPQLHRPVDLGSADDLPPYNGSPLVPQASPAPLSASASFSSAGSSSPALFHSQPRSEPTSTHLYTSPIPTPSVQTSFGSNPALSQQQQPQPAPYGSNPQQSTLQPRPDAQQQQQQQQQQYYQQLLQQQQESQRQQQQQQERERLLQQQQQESQRQLQQQQMLLMQQRAKEQQAVAPAGAKDMQTLLGNYPNPSTESEKLKQMMETMSQQLNAHFKRMEYFTESMENRLSALEHAVKDMNKSRGRESTSSRERESSRKRSKSHSAATPDARQLESDEEMARKLQQQFNSESTRPETVHVVDKQQERADEDYAQRLQAMYIKRDLAKSTPTKTKKTDDKKKDDKADGDGKPASLWSRLFGAPNDEDNDDEELKPVTTSSAKKDTSSASKVTTVGSYPGLTGQTTGAVQAMPMPQYGFYPQQPFMIAGQGMPAQYAQYVPMQTQGGPYIMQAPPSSHN